MTGVASMSLPLVSVGMPVYNGERTVGAAIESILHQSWPKWELVISDNASTDGTSRICLEYASHEPRIRYLRQAGNLGAPANFREVLDESRGEFFMWAAADDRRSNDFIEANVTFLTEHPEHVASCSPVRLDAAEFDPRYLGDEPVAGSRSQRILAVIPAHANGRFYSVFRREALLDCDLIDRSFLGSDWAIMIHVATKGPMHRVDSGWTLLGTQGASRSGNLYRAWRGSLFDVLIPFRVLSAYAWMRSEDFSVAEKARLGFKLAHLNAFGLYAQMTEAWRRLRR
jgi:glycosyltransferase involved in cell wall biosynthesis